MVELSFTRLANMLYQFLNVFCEFFFEMLEIIIRKGSADASSAETSLLSYTSVFSKILIFLAFNFQKNTLFDLYVYKTSQSKEFSYMNWLEKRHGRKLFEYIFLILQLNSQELLLFPSYFYSIYWSWCIEWIPPS